MPHPKVPIIFSEATTSVIGHQASILLPKAGDKMVDYEGELAVIIGKKGKNILPENAMDHIFGYTCANDVSARTGRLRSSKVNGFAAKVLIHFAR